MLIADFKPIILIINEYSLNLTTLKISQFKKINKYNFEPWQDIIKLTSQYLLH